MFLKKALLFEQCSTLLTFESVSECCVRCKRLLGGQGHLAFLALEVVLGSLVHLQRSCIVALEVAIFALVYVRFHVARHLVPKCRFIRRNKFIFVNFKLFLYLGIFWRQVGHLSVWTLTIFTADWKIVIIVCEKDGWPSNCFSPLYPQYWAGPCFFALGRSSSFSRAPLPRACQKLP